MRRSTPKIVTLIALAGLTGCAQTSQFKESLFRTQDSAVTTIDDLSGKTKGVKGQIATMGSAISSAYSKTKSALASPFTAAPTSDDPVSLASGLPEIGPELHVANGQLNESQGNYTRALNSYSKALELDGKNVSALAAVARLYDRQNNLPAAIEFYNKAIEVAGNDSDLIHELGDCYARSDNLDEARKKYQAASNLKPSESKHRIALAGVLLDQGQKQEAMSELSQTESSAMANYRMAYLLVSRQKVAEAQAHLSQALVLDPNLQPARDLMAKMGNSQFANQAASAYRTGTQVVGAVNQLFKNQPAATAQPYTPQVNAFPSSVPPSMTVPASANSPLPLGQTSLQTGPAAASTGTSGFPVPSIR